MTTATSTPVLSILASHGFASIDDAREANVFHVCHACGSIKTCTPAPGQTREEQARVLLDNFDMTCCEDGDESIL